MPTFMPTPSDVRINIFWFLSLIFSLVTVLIGIVSLQWLREHLHRHTDPEPQIALSLHHLNVESLDRWYYLPQIFTTLPLLLQFALILFLAGVYDFLWTLNTTVAIPVTVAVGSSLLFFLWTTVMPTMQALSLFLPRWSWGNMPRSPCPYRSPQSWAFHQSVRPLITIFLSIFGDIDIDNPPPPFEGCRFASHRMILEKDCGFHPFHNETTSRRQRRPIDLIFRPSRSNNWAELGIAWLFQRGLDFMEKNPRSTKKISTDDKIRPVPMYDTVQAIMIVNKNGSSRDNLLAHHCVQPIVQCNKSVGTYIWYLSHLVDYWRSDDDPPETLSVDALTHCNMLRLHQTIGFEQVDDIRNSVVELVVKITRAMFADGALCLDDVWAGPFSPMRSCMIEELPGTCT